ncbi:MAG TPA: SUMF1/EgtB/PvdO family nonheme iron enzyme [Balneolaceae bacterium]|nr:SUMF1/EgtB/PvdO family nonheme iron enzyme [Balneolaceae bacterium]
MRLKPFIFVLFLLPASGCFVFQKSSENVPKPQMVLIKGGSFKMGDVYGDDNPDALPVHSVTLSNFKIGQYEVTYRQYDAFARRTGRPLPPADSLGRGNRAVVYIDWNDARAFCRFHGGRLPTEQEWEYAARSGGKKVKFAGTNSVDSLHAYAFIESNSAAHSFPVGLKKPNAAGLYDMSGNVLEWIGAYYPLYPKEGEKPEWADLNKPGVRILRGGSFAEPANIASTYWRVGMLMDAKAPDVGFRCVDPLE